MGIDEDNWTIRIKPNCIEIKEDADRMVELAQSKIDLLIEIVYIAPLYRVRAGYFTEKSEVEKYVKFLRDKGFKEARWVTPTKTQY